jgi:hypothetical protein
MRDPEPKTDAELVEENRQLQRARAKATELRKIVKALERELEGAGRTAVFLDKLAEAPDPKPIKVRKRRNQGKRLPAASYVALASDWHMGERVRPEQIGHRNEYNPEIAQERADQFFRSNVTLLSGARSLWDVRQMVLWLGGDLMTGYIHEELMEENFLSPVEEALLVYETFRRGIQYLLDETDLDCILIPTSFGNHGRTSLRIRIHSGARNSYEWMLYHFLARHFEEEPRVHFQISNGYNNLVDLYGLRINFHHGDAVKYAGGVGGLAVPVNRRIGRIATSIPPEWEGTERGAPHLDVFGHYHQRLYPGSFIANGSNIGWNDFAERFGFPFEKPAQTSFVVDEKYRLVNQYNAVLVDKARRGRKG